MTYPSICKYFKSIKHFSEEDFFRAVLMTYGWMPTILKLDLNSKSLHKAKKILVDIKNKDNPSYSLTEQDLKKLIGVINNSLSGATKVLHFSIPEKFPIWDTTIAKELNPSGKKNQKAYFSYLEVLKTITEKDKKALSFHVTKEIRRFLKKDKYEEVSFVRALDILIFLHSVIKAETKETKENHPSGVAKQS